MTLAIGTASKKNSFFIWIKHWNVNNWIRFKSDIDLVCNFEFSIIFFFYLLNSETNLDLDDMKSKPVPIVNGDEVGVRRGRRGVAKFDVPIVWFLHNRFDLSFR